MQPPPHSASRVFAPVVGRKTPPVQVATGDDHHMCKWSICTSCWKEKHHQCKLQQVLITTCASGVFAPVDGRKHHQRKVQRSGPASGQIGAGCSNSSCNDNHHTTDQIRTSKGAVGVPDAAINATCVRAHHNTSTCPILIYEPPSIVCTCMRISVRSSRVTLYLSYLSCYFLKKTFQV